MRVYVLNGAGRLPTLKGKATFVTADNATLKETVRSLAVGSQPFVLIWHEDPKVGLRILNSLRDENQLPANFRGCVFFRALRYAGLDTEAKAKAYLMRAGFEEEAHIISNIVSGDNPPKDVLHRFDIFVDAVREMGDENVPLPFRLLEPLAGAAKRALARLVLFLAQRSVSKGLLAIDEVLAAVEWSPVLRDAELDFADNWPSPDPIPTREQLLCSLYGPEVTLNYEPLCLTCHSRSILEHSSLKYDVILPGIAVVKGKWPKGKAKPNDGIRNTALMVADEIELLLVSATRNADLFGRRIVSLIAPYLKQPSESFRLAASQLLIEEFKAKCDLHLNYSKLQQGAATLRKASIPCPSGGEEGGEDDFLHELITVAKTLRLNMQCGNANNAQVRQS
jgi:hypothetical protein